MSLKKEIKKFKQKILWAKLKLANYKIIHPPQGCGDIVVTLMGLRHLKKKGLKPKTAIVVTKKHFKDLCEIFSDCCDKIIYCENIFKFPKYVLDIAKLVYGPNSHFDKFEEAILETMDIKESVDVADIPQIPNSPEIEKLFNDGTYKIGKTVLITPEATTSQDCFKENFWLNCADKLKEKGYYPVFNSKTQYGEYPSVLYNLVDTINFVKKAGNVLSFRSGLTDVLGCFCDVFQVVIYPNNWKAGDMPYVNGFDDDPNGRYMEDGSLNRLYPHKKFIEYIHSNEIDPTQYFQEAK